jgi:hypothetical protein
MKLFLRICLAVFAFTVALPVATYAQGSCPSGYTYTSLPGGGFECIPISSGQAPEISASASGAGLILVAGMAMIIRGRKRFETNA